MEENNVGMPVKVKFSDMINKIMAYYGLNRVDFARKYRIEPSQVTRWLDNGQEPRAEVRLRMRMEYDKIKDKEPPIMQLLA